MLYFVNDYSEGAHEKVLQHLIDTNMKQLSGYGTDHYCETAKEKIKKACGCEDAEVYLLTGGTQTNQIVIDTMLAPYEGVVAAHTGHVSTHEAGAIEFTGHKVLELPEKNGKICASDLKELVETFYGDDNHEHMVFPGMVYISHPTEYGTLYSKKELEELSSVCRKYKLPLFLDGARLIYGLVSKETDVTLHDIARLCDVFYIGGTKAGLLCGEAVVFTGKCMPKHFLTRVKQHGALLAKGRLLGVQFDALFTDDLYLRHSCNHCQYKANQNGADIIVGDFYQSTYAAGNDGCSCLYAMNEKGEEVIKRLSGEVMATDYRTIGSVNGMLWSSVSEHPRREEFFARYKNTLNPTESMFTDFLPMRFKVKKIMNQLGVFAFVRKKILRKK